MVAAKNFKKAIPRALGRLGLGRLGMRCAPLALRTKYWLTQDTLFHLPLGAVVCAAIGAKLLSMPNEDLLNLLPTRGLGWGLIIFGGLALLMFFNVCLAVAPTANKICKEKIAVEKRIQGIKERVNAEKEKEALLDAVRAGREDGPDSNRAGDGLSIQPAARRAPRL